jgi:predicted phosphate transport protein (TIGR00153 family)
MAKVMECSQELSAFIDASCNDDWQEAEAVYNKISELENQADEDKKNIRLNLPKSLFMPIGRNDLLELVSKQDQVANTAKDIAGIILGRQMKAPEQLQSQLKDYVNASIKTVAEANTIVHELDELIETGFGGREIEWIEKLIHRLDEMETASDKLQIEIRAALHKIENHLPPVDVMFLYKIIELIGNLADKAQKVGDQIHVIVAR